MGNAVAVLMAEEELEAFALEEANRGLQFALNKLDIFDEPNDVSEEQADMNWSYLRDHKLKVVFDD